MKGFTLIEIIIALALFSLLVAGIYPLYDINQKAYGQGQDLAEIDQNGRVILERVSRDLRQAQKLVSDMPQDKGSGIPEIVFEDGHDMDKPFRYVHYYKDEQSNIQKEIYAFCFSQDGQNCVQQEAYVAYSAAPPEGQTLLKVVLQEPRIMGEFVQEMLFWGANPVNIYILLQKGEKTAEFETQILGRNL